MRKRTIPHYSKDKRNKKDTLRVALVFTITQPFGGVRRRILRVYNELCRDKNRISCDVIVGGVNEIRARELFELADCPVDNLNIQAVEEKKRLPLQLIAHHNYDVVHFLHFNRVLCAMQALCAIMHIPVLLTICDYIQAYGLRSSSREKLVHTQWRQSDYIDLLYPLAEEHVKQFTQGKISITPGTFTNLNLFKPAPKDKVIVFSAARLEETKGVQLLMDSINVCQNTIRSHGYQLIVLGRGYLEDYLRSFITEEKLNDIVKMVGYQKTSEHLPSASIFLSLQKYENYPSQSLAEAVACGCYIICTDVGDSRKCASEEFARFVPEDNPEALHEALKEYFIKDEEEKIAVVSAARKFALDKYSIATSLEYYSGILEKLGCGSK